MNLPYWYARQNQQAQPMPEPTIAELTQVIALLILESDSLREQSHKHILGEGRRTYTRERLEEARQLKPTATISHSGTLVVSING